MKNVIDVHTHTMASGHAYTTLLENAREAANKGIKVLGVSDHGPKMPGGPHIFYFGNLRVVPRELFGVKILRGCEANIIDFQGNIDIPERIQNSLDYIIASLHDVCIVPGNEEQHTNAYLEVMDNPNVMIIGHSGNPSFPMDNETFVKKAKEKDIIIEINNSSFKGARKGCEATCYNIARLCRDYGVKIIFGSDAHTCYQIGEFKEAEALIEDLKIPEDLIMNNDESKFINYLKKKGKNI
jgi:putative hydrolase